MNLSGIEWLCVDIANNFGLDKELFQDRIQWVKDNFHDLESLEAKEDPFLYKASVQALRKVVAGEPTGYLISLDSTCSGLQILSALTGCVKGARITNLTGEVKRFDAYTEITNVQNEFLKTYGLHTVKTVARSDSKQAVMTSLYGSEKTPKDIFGEEGPLLEAFYEACFDQAPGAFQLLTTMKNAWQPYALEHTWKLPDGFDAIIKVMQQKETRIEVDELDKHKFKTIYKENLGSERGISLAANITHSVDAYVLRTLIRRCSYKPKLINNALAAMKAAGNDVELITDPIIEDAVHMYMSTRMPETRILNHISEENAKQVPLKLRAVLMDIAERMVANKPFPVLTVHDAFRIHPNNGNTLSYWYREILAELADSNLLNHILSMITGSRYTLPKLSRGLSESIRQSSYPIC